MTAATIAGTVPVNHEAAARGRKARKLADVLLRPEMGLRTLEARTAETVLRDLPEPSWATVADLAHVPAPSRKTICLTAAIVRQRLEK